MNFGNIEGINIIQFKYIYFFNYFNNHFSFYLSKIYPNLYYYDNYHSRYNNCNVKVVFKHIKELKLQEM